MFDKEGDNHPATVVCPPFSRPRKHPRNTPSDNYRIWSQGL